MSTIVAATGILALLALGTLAVLAGAEIARRLIEKDRDGR